MNNIDTVIEVNEKDEVQGYLEKMDAHVRGCLHRAISVFVVNQKGEWLLQQRAAEKYHSKLKWSNACCTHPMKGETTEEAAKRRLVEEMGMTADVKRLFSFIYKAELDNGLIEHELDHVFIAETDDLPQINEEEVAAYRYLSLEELSEEVAKHPENFTVWFLLLFDRVKQHLSS